MRTETRKVEIEKEYYFCEVCGKEFEHHWAATKCERDHKEKECEHKNTTIIINTEARNDYDGDAEINIEIIKKCLDCDKRLEEKEIDDCALEDFLESKQELLQELLESEEC